MTSGGDVSAQSIRRMTLPPIYGLGCYSYPDWMMAGVKATYWAVIGADKRADNNPNWAYNNVRNYKIHWCYLSTYILYKVLGGSNFL